MEQDKRTADDTLANILLEFIADAEVKETPCKLRTRTKSVEKARALLLDRSRPPAGPEEVIIETELEEDFVVLELTTRSASVNKHLISSSACGEEATSVKRPGTLPLSAADPGDPPLFSPSCSYPPPSRMSVHTQSSPTLSASIVPSCNRASSQSQLSTCSVSDPNKMRARVIAERLKKIGDLIDSDQKQEKRTERLANLMSPFGTTSSGSIWQKVTRLFRSIYSILSDLNAEYGDSRPPDQDPRWQLFCKTWGVLRDDLVPQISIFGGWTAFLRETAAIIVSPRPDDHHMIGSPCIPLTLPISHSSPTCLPSNHPRSRQLLQEYQPSPGSRRSLRINRSHTLPCERHPRKLWSLSESGSLVDGDGNDDFSESFKLESEQRESDLEGSRVSLDNVLRILEQCSDSEDDEPVFALELPSLSIVSSPHCQETNETEPLCDSGHVSSWETLSISSTPPSFVVGSTPLHTDSAVDVSSPQATREKIRPKSGGSFGKHKEEISPFDRARSRSLPMSSRSERTKKRSNEVTCISTAHPLYNNGSISLSSISESVLYEAVRSLLS